MKPLLLFLITILFISSCGNPSQKESEFPAKSDPVLLKKLFSQGKTQGFFALQSNYDLNKSKLSEKHVLYFNAILENAFNNPQASNMAINKLEKSFSDVLGDTLMQNLYEIKILNHTNLYEYKLAAQAGESLLKNYAHILDSNSIADLENTNKIWVALSEVPKQQVIRNRDFTLPLPRNVVGLYNISTTFPDSTLDFIFDTGANFSVIRRSLVDELGLQLIKSDFQVMAATGTQVKSDLAVAADFNIGGITVKNAVFLVFEDEALTFPGFDIFGIIGYPVIEAMKEIHFGENEIFVPKELTAYSHHNFALDGLMPIVSAKHRSDELIFHFDTGAGSTTLFPKYFKQYQKDIEANYEKETFTSGSAGGVVEFEGYNISDFKLSIAGSEATMDSLRLHVEKIAQQENNFHGNLGQDFIRQFDKMIISFAHSSILFE